MKYKKYNLLEFIAASEGEYFDVIEPDNLEWAKDAISNWSESILKNPIHQGDCTKESQPCNLCVLEMTLKEYHDYRFHFNHFIIQEGIKVKT